MIGQKNLLEKLNKYSIDTFPRTILLLGEKGSGKHLIVNYIKENIVKLPIIDLTEILSYETLDNIYRKPNPIIYLINLSNLTEKNQNVLLKFIEEPLNNSFIILIAESVFNLLNTIVNRCFILELDKYSVEDLNLVIAQNNLSFNNKDDLLKIVRTPGQLINLNGNDEVFDLCDKIINKIHLANYANVLTISSKINYKDNYDKYDIDLLFDTLLYKLFSKYKEEDNKKSYQMYLLTAESRKKLIDKRLNKEQFMQNYLTSLWEVSKKYE